MTLTTTVAPPATLSTGVALPWRCRLHVHHVLLRWTGDGRSVLTCDRCGRDTGEWRWVPPARAPFRASSDGVSQAWFASLGSHRP